MGKVNFYGKFGGFLGFLFYKLSLKEQLTLHEGDEVVNGKLVSF